MGRATRSGIATLKPRKAVTLAKSILEDTFMDYGRDNTEEGRLLWALAEAVVRERKIYLKTGKW